MEPEILLEDSEITVAIKPPMLLSERSDSKESFAELLAKRNPKNYVGVVHRLDLGVGGVMVYARTPSAAAILSRAVAERTMQKEYLAVIHGEPTQKEGRWTDLLFFDRARNKSFTVDRSRKGVKEAILDYRVIESVDSTDFGRLSLVHIVLQTGRTHQIRVQFSSRRHPLLGDRKYGATDRCPIALYSHKLSFSHPTKHTRLSFSKKPSDLPWSLFSKLETL